MQDNLSLEAWTTWVVFYAYNWVDGNTQTCQETKGKVKRENGGEQGCLNTVVKKLNVTINSLK